MSQVERETLETDVLIVGGGPAGLSCALRLAQLIKAHREPRSSSGPSLSTENIYLRSNPPPTFAVLPSAANVSVTSISVFFGKALVRGM